jgi:phospholipase A1
LNVGKAEGLLLGANFRFASKGPSMQLDMTYPLSMGFFKNFDFYFHIQYADTLAETLLDYTKRTEALRIGLAIVR